MSGSVGPCTICDLITLFQTLVSQANSYFALPLAALMLGYGGFLMVLSGLQGSKPSLFAKGKTVLTNAVIGIVIIFCSWIAIDTLLKIIGGYQHASASNFGPWHVIECVSPVVKWPKHFTCNGDKCEEVDGYSIAGCTEARNCGPKAEHLGCHEGSCQWLKGEGANTCAEGDDPKCKLQERHKECISNSCVSALGPGPDTCQTNEQCAAQTGNEYERNKKAAEQLAVITFTSASPDCDGKSAATNYEEMLNSRPLTICHAGCKTDKLPCTQQGRTAKPEMMENLVSLAYQSGLSFQVTSISTGQHSAGSDHYDGKGRYR